MWWLAFALENLPAAGRSNNSEQQVHRPVILTMHDGRMKEYVISAALILSVTAAALANTPTPQLKGSQFLAQTKITLPRARATALATEHGTIVDQELEHENGHLRYSFDVKIKSVVHEVGIDALTGAVLEDSIDNGNG